MRTVTAPLNVEDAEIVRQLAGSSKLSKQVDIVEDIYSFMKSPDILDERDLTTELIEEFVDGKFEYYLPMKRKVKGRIAFFQRIKDHPYYPKFQQMGARNGAETMLKMLNAYLKDKKDPNKDANGQQEQDEAMKQFENIIYYGQRLFDLLDDEMFQQYMSSQGVNIPTAGDEEGDPQKMVQVVEDIVNHFSKELQIFELSQKLEFTLRLSKKGKYNDTNFPDNGLDIRRIRSTSDLPHILPTQMAMDDDLFVKKLVNRELLKKQPMQRQEKRQVLYMMVDCSGSMGEVVYKELNRLDVCKAIVIALMKRMVDNEDLFFFRWFKESQSDLMIVKDKASALEFIKNSLSRKHPDGGTDIMGALYRAAKDINDKAMAQVDKADILLISDGMATIDVADVNKKLDGIDLHTVMVGAGKYDPKNEYHSKFVQISKNYLMTDCKKDEEIIGIANVFSR